MEQVFLEIGKIVNTHGLKGDVKVVPWSDYPEIFEEIKYRYVGSFTEKGVNSSLRLPQIRHFDVVGFKPTNAQRTYLENLMRQTSFKYVFASKQDIENGFIQFAGHRYNIAEHAKLILVGNSSILKKESHVKDILNKDNSNNNSYVKIKL